RLRVPAHRPGARRGFGDPLGYPAGMAPGDRTRGGRAGSRDRQDQVRVSSSADVRATVRASHDGRGDRRGGDGRTWRRSLLVARDQAGQRSEVPVLSSVALIGWDPEGGAICAHVVQIPVDRDLYGDIGGDRKSTRLNS